MKTLSNIIFLTLLSQQTFSQCIDKKTDPEIQKVMLEASKSILDPKNEKVVPPGVPIGKYDDRSYQIIATIQTNALIYFSFKNKGKDAAFVAPYSYVAKTKSLLPVELPDLGNNDSRFWDVKTKITNRCKKPVVSITYDTCTACGEGNDLTGRFLYNQADSTWSFSKSP
jgi:hypothetical protein